MEARVVNFLLNVVQASVSPHDSPLAVLEVELRHILESVSVELCADCLSKADGVPRSAGDNVLEKFVV